MKILFENEEYMVEEGKTIQEAFGNKITSEDVIAARYNHSIASLHQPIFEDGEISFITRQEKDGRDIYIRGLLYLMSKTVDELYPKCYLTVNYQLSNSMFCQTDNLEMTQEMLDHVKQKMQETIDRDLPIRKLEMTQEEAKQFYAKEATLRGRLQANSYKEKVSLYFCEDYYNYFYGTMPISTGFAKEYNLTKFRNGFLLEYPEIRFFCYKKFK